MNKPRIKKKFSVLIIIISLVNILTLFIWFLLNISPIIPRINSIKNITNNKEIKNQYNVLEELYLDIDYVEDKYNISITILDKNNKELTNNKNSTNFCLFTYMVNVENDTYLIKAYSTKNISISSLFLGLFIFQIIVITIIFSFIIMFSRKIIFKPIDELINTIKNYKYGIKPNIRNINNEFDIINNEFTLLTKQLDKEKEEQNRIIASISHDIKTPLTSIIGYSNLISESNDIKEVEKYNKKIYNKAIHIKELVSTFDEYLISHDNVPLKLSNIKISDLIKELNDDYKIELENKNIKFNIKSTVNNESIKIDILKIKRVFSNIISNSTRYIDKNGKIDINISNDNEYIKFLVSDNGPGISEDIIDKIFDPLFTTDNSRHISGLGLSICKEFINLHGGIIEAYNDNGLTIMFKLPK